MPAASAKKCARQRANKLLQMEAETTTLSDALLSAQTAETSAETATPAPWPSPAPTSFTITYSPLSISHPEPIDPAAHLLSDAVRVTRNELAMMLCQSYLHGSEHGWKVNLVMARERLQAEYEKDMRDGTTKFAEHEKQICTEEIGRASCRERV